MTLETIEVTEAPEMPNVELTMDELMSHLNFEDEEVVEKQAPQEPDNELVLEAAIAQISDEEAQAEEKKAVKAEAKKEKVAKAAKPPKAPKEPKAAKAPRKFYTSKVERVSDKLGSQLGEFTVLTIQDAMLTGDALVAKQKETLEIMGKAGVKVQNRMTMFLEFASGRTKKLNNVLETTLRLLASDGKIVMGDKGNLHQKLLAHPYSAASARAMGGNSIIAMREFKMIQRDTDGSYVVNPDSLIWMKLVELLGL